MSNIVLIGAIAVIWGVIAFLGRRAVSIVPIVPLVPAVLIVVGIGLNTWKPWAGTLTDGALHILVAGLVAFGLFREKKQTPPSDGGGSAV